MTGWPRVRFFLILFGIFLAGAGIGTLGTLGYLGKRRAPPMPERIGGMMLRNWIEPLGLDAAQVERIRPLVDQTAKELAESRRESMRAGAEILARFEREIAGELTDEQRRLFEDKQKERRERWRQASGQRPGPARPRKEPPPASEPREREDEREEGRHAEEGRP